MEAATAAVGSRCQVWNPDWVAVVATAVPAEELVMPAAQALLGSAVSDLEAEDS